MNRHNYRLTFPSCCAPIACGLAGLWLVNMLASCAPTSHPSPEADDPFPEPEGGAASEEAEETETTAFDGSRAATTDAPDASTNSIDAVVDAGSPQLCGTDGTLNTLLGCNDAQITIPPCATGHCDAGPPVPPDWTTFVDAVEGATNGAVAAQARDGGADAACQTTYVACVAANPTQAGIDQCDAEATECGFDTDAGPSIACSADFATCFAANPFAYDQCIGAFRACEQALSSEP